MTSFNAGLIDSAHFHVHQPEWQRDSADHVFRDFGWHTRILFGPRDPDHAVWRKQVLQYRQSAGQHFRLSGEYMGHVAHRARIRGHLQIRNVPTKQAGVVSRWVNDADALTLPEAESLVEGVPE
ncbi:MAG: hypothetical protein ACRENP_28950 [Longimicrobiales bacterium]